MNVITDISVGQRVRSVMDGMTGYVTEVNYSSVKVAWDDGAKSIFRMRDGFTGFSTLPNVAEEVPDAARQE